MVPDSGSESHWKHLKDIASASLASPKLLLLLRLVVSLLPGGTPDGTTWLGGAEPTAAHSLPRHSQRRGWRARSPYPTAVSANSWFCLRSQECHFCSCWQGWVFLGSRGPTCAGSFLTDQTLNLVKRWRLHHFPSKGRSDLFPISRWNHRVLAVFRLTFRLWDGRPAGGSHGQVSSPS